MHLIEINHQEVYLHPLMEEVDHHQDMGLLAMTPGQGEDISQEGFPINIRLTQELEEDLQEVAPGFTSAYQDRIPSPKVPTQFNWAY